MIKLSVEEYCQNCPWIEPDIERPVELFSCSELYSTVGDTTIKCKNRHICDRVAMAVEKRFYESKF